MKRIDRIKKRILNSLKDREIIKIKICKASKKDCYHMEIGDTKNMDMKGSKGVTGLRGFDIKTILREIEDEMECLR